VGHLVISSSFLVDCYFSYASSSSSLTTAGYTDAFLAEVGSDSLPEDTPRETNFCVGDDQGQYRAPEPEPEPDPLPAQVNQEPDADPEGDPEPDPELLQQIDDIAASFSNLDMAANIIPCKPFYVPAIKIKGEDPGAITNAMGIICFFGAGTVLSSLDIELLNDLQSVKVKGHLANEMGKASHLLPSGFLFKHNPMIFESLK